MEVAMGQAGPFKPIALVVEDDILQRERVVALLEESEMGVIECEDTQGALGVLDKLGDCVSVMFIDTKPTGKLDDVELARFATQSYPNIHAIVTSAIPPTKSLPKGVTVIPKQWLPLDVLREAARSLH
jgi:DNA-binding NtrC family response regulator